MKDAYSFDADLDGLQRSVPTRCTTRTRRSSPAAGSRSARSKAQSGEIGGDTSQEFMAVAAVGEDDVRLVRALRLRGQHRGRDARRSPPTRGAAPATRPRASRCTPPTCPASTASPSTSASTPDRAAEVHRVRRRRRARARARPRRPRGQRVRARRGCCPAARSRLYTDADFAAHPELPKGYIGPDFAGATLVVADPLGARAPHGWVTGANETDHHVRDAVLGRDFTSTAGPRSSIVEPRRPVPELRRSRCRSTAASRSVTCSSSAPSTPRRSARSTPTTTGEQHPMVMGCYGIGVSRDRRRGRRGAPRRARASRGRPRSRRTTCTSSRCRARATTADGARGRRPLYAELRAAGVDGALRRPRREPGREVRRRRPARHAGAAHRRREGPGPGRGRAQAPRHRRARRARRSPTPSTRSPRA